MRSRWDAVRRAVAFALVLFPLAGCDEREGWIVVQNDTSRGIVMVSIEPCGAPMPGPNRLDPGPIQPGGNETFPIAFGCYDVAVLTDDQIPGVWRVRIDAGSRRVTVFAVDPPSPSPNG